MTIYRLYDIRKKYFLIKLEKVKLTIGMLLLSLVTIIYYLNNSIISIITPFITLVILVIINKKSILKSIDIIKKERLVKR